MIATAEKAMIRKRLFENYFHLFDEPITLSAGDKANNKMDIEPMRGDPAMRELVIPVFSELVVRHQPDFVVGVPNGATWLADAVAVETGCYVAHLFKDEDGNVDYEDDFIDRELVTNELSSGVLIEDVTRTMGNVNRALAVEGLGEKIIAIATLVDRNPYSQRRKMPEQPVEALISEHIPEMLPVAR